MDGTSMPLPQGSPDLVDQYVGANKNAGGGDLVDNFMNQSKSGAPAIQISTDVPNWTSEKQAFANPPTAGPSGTMAGFGPPPIGSNTAMSAAGMRTSLPPQAIRAGAGALPPVLGTAGGMGGAALGAEAPPVGPFVGGPAGAGIGTAVGNTARQGILRNVFGDTDVPAPFSKEGLKESAMYGGLASILEIPGAIMQGYGSIMLKRLGGATSANQTGDVIAAFNQVAPKAISREGLEAGLEKAQEKLSTQLTPQLAGIPGTRNLDTLLAQARYDAMAQDLKLGLAKSRTTQLMGQPYTQMGRTTVVSDRLEQMITAAEINAKITSRDVTAQQLADFQRQLRRVGFGSKEIEAQPTIGGLAKNLTRDIYSNIGVNLRQMAPEAGRTLDQMHDIHAAIDALDKYKPGKVASTAITAATHPVTSAAVSPFTIPAAIVSKKVGGMAADAGYGLLRGLVGP